MKIKLTNNEDVVLERNNVSVNVLSTLDNKVSSTTITNIQVVSSMPASPDSNTLYIVQ